VARMLGVGAWRGGRGVGMDALRALRLLVISIKDVETAGGIWLMVTCVAKYQESLSWSRGTGFYTWHWSIVKYGLFVVQSHG